MGKEISFAPWTPEQIDALDERQGDMTKHPYTCECGESLTVYEDGWHCDYCHNYFQNWAWEVDTIISTTRRRYEKDFLPRKRQ